jgi:hypothetical protein
MAELAQKKPSLGTTLNMKHGPSLAPSWFVAAEFHSAPKEHRQKLKEPSSNSTLIFFTTEHLLTPRKIQLQKKRPNLT